MACSATMDGPAAYDRYVVPFATPFAQAAVSAAARAVPSYVCDHGAGTGLVTGLVHERWPGARVLALDPDAGMLDRLTARFGEAAWLEARCATLRAAGPLGPFDACL